MAGENEQRAGIELYYRIKAASKRATTWFQQQLQKIRKGLGDTATAVKSFSSGLGETTQPLETTAKDLGVSNQELANFARQAVDAGASVKGLSQELGVSEDQIRRWVGIAGEAVETSDAWNRVQTQSIKKALLWGAGVASAYALYSKLRRSLEEGYRELFKNTEEYERLTKASGEFRRALILSIATVDQYKNLMDGLADALDATGDALVKGKAKQEAINQLISESTDRREKQLLMAMRAGRVIGTVAERTEVAARVQERANKIYEEAEDAIEKAGDAYESLAVRIDRALKSYRENLGAQITDRYIEHMQDMQDATTNRLQGQLEAWRDFNDRAEDLARQHSDDLADLNTDIARRAADIMQSYQDAMEDLGGEVYNRREELIRDHHDRLLKLELAYQEKVRRINEDYQMEMYEAVAERDATAALKAERRRKLELKRAGREYTTQQKLAQVDYRDRLDDLDRYQEDKRREIERNQRREMRDLNTYERRKRQDLQLSLDRQLRDLDYSLNERLTELDYSYREERTLAAAHYTQQEEMYRQHLQNMLNLQRAYSGGGFDVTQHPRPGYQHGGSFITSRPQSITVGEGGRPELVQITPLSGTMTHRYTGDLNHHVSTRIEQAVAGMEGRMSAAIQEAMRGLFR